MRTPPVNYEFAHSYHPRLAYSEKRVPETPPPPLPAFTPPTTPLYTRTSPAVLATYLAIAISYGIPIQSVPRRGPPRGCNNLVGRRKSVQFRPRFATLTLGNVAQRGVLYGMERVNTRLIACFRHPPLPDSVT